MSNVKNSPKTKTDRWFSHFILVRQCRQRSYRSRVTSLHSLLLIEFESTICPWRRDRRTSFAGWIVVNSLNRFILENRLILQLWRLRIISSLCCSCALCRINIQFINLENLADIANLATRRTAQILWPASSASSASTLDLRQTMFDWTWSTPVHVDSSWSVNVHSKKI